MRATNWEGTYNVIYERETKSAEIKLSDFLYDI